MRLEQKIKEDRTKMTHEKDDSQYATTNTTNVAAPVRNKLLTKAEADSPPRKTTLNHITNKKHLHFFFQ